MPQDLPTKDEEAGVLIHQLSSFIDWGLLLRILTHWHFWPILCMGGESCWGQAGKKPSAYMGTVHQAESDLWDHARGYDEGNNHT